MYVLLFKSISNGSPNYHKATLTPLSYPHMRVSRYTNEQTDDRPRYDISSADVKITAP